MEPSQQRTPSPADGVHVSRPQPVAERPVTHAQPVAATPVQQPTELIVPLSVVSRSDISRSLRELEALDDYFHQAAIRGGQASELPTLGRALNNFATANQLNLLHPEARSRLKEFLVKLKAKAPVVHMSFPSDPSEAFTAKLLEWFRREAHPYTVLHIGLQPELAAGCMIRTTNKMLDLSFRKRFEQSKQKLVAALHEAGKEPDRVVVADANATVAEEARL